MLTTNFIDRKLADKIAREFGTPCYVYDETSLRMAADQVLAFPNAYGLTARFAMKACPNANILRLFKKKGLKIDASSIYEAERALMAGYEASDISLSTQEFPDGDSLAALVEKGMSVNACSLHQLEKYGKRFPNTQVGLRFNPGLGSGGTNRTNVGGPASSFGIWHESKSNEKTLTEKYGLNVFRIHTHIGSGSDPEVWIRAVSLSLDMVRYFEDATHLNLGGGYKVGRIAGEKTTDLQMIGNPMKHAFEAFAEATGRKIHLEVEPGTYLVANSCVLLSSVQDLASTGEGGYDFIKLDSGMTENTRPSMYGSQHEIQLLSPTGEKRAEKSYIVVGHCCESGDILTPAPADPEALHPRILPEARIGDLVVIGGVGAYCSSMATKNYNSFPECPEALIRLDGSVDLMRKRQSLREIVANETEIAF